jgi:hypothetical protein
MSEREAKASLFRLNIHERNNYAMKLDEAIMQVEDLLRGNNISRETKVRWLSELDEAVYREVILTHEGADKVSYNRYTPDTDGDTELLIPFPHDAVYIEYLKMKINSELYEYTRYNANLNAFTSMMDAFRKAYNREHMPKRRHGFAWWR